jgi:hypothetical protein
MTVSVKDVFGKVFGFLGGIAPTLLKFQDVIALALSVIRVKMSQGDVAIFRAAMKLLEKDPPQRPVRLLGVGACQVTDTPKLPAAQLDLFEPPAKPAAEAKLDRVVDRLREKYGRDALKRGTWT